MFILVGLGEEQDEGEVSSLAGVMIHIRGQAVPGWWTSP